jgi:hypothetical protein
LLFPLALSPLCGWSQFHVHPWRFQFVIKPERLLCFLMLEIRICQIPLQQENSKSRADHVNSPCSQLTSRTKGCQHSQPRTKIYRCNHINSRRTANSTLVLNFYLLQPVIPPLWRIWEKNPATISLQSLSGLATKSQELMKKHTSPESAACCWCIALPCFRELAWRSSNPRITEEKTKIRSNLEKKKP